MADVLYGVTVQEQGVSKIVSVRFHKADEAVTDHQPASLETPTAVRPVDQEEDEPHKREETLEIAIVAQEAQSVPGHSEFATPA